LKRVLILAYLFVRTEPISPKGFPTIAPSAAGGRLTIDDNPNGVTLGARFWTESQEIIDATLSVASKFTARKGNSFGVVTMHFFTPGLHRALW